MSSEPEQNSRSTSSIPPLWQGLIDDAAVFPPGNATVPDAVAAHAHHRTAWYADCIGPLLLPVSAVSAFHNTILTTGVTIPRVGLAVRPGAATLEEITAAVERLNDIPGTTVAAVETALPEGVPQAEAATELTNSFGAALPDSCDLWLEVRSAEDTHDAMSVIRHHKRPVGAKYRMGGVNAAGFPSVAAAFTVLEAAVTTGVRLKLTAGLHHLHRFADHDINATHHGFGNVMTCLHALLTGQSTTVATEVLADPVTTHTEAILHELSADAITALRSVIASFGCCGVTEPVDDLVGAGLLHNPTQ